MSRLEVIRPAKPSLRERLLEQLRSFTLGPYNIKDRELARLFGGRTASSGVAVNETTALNYAAVWAAVNLVAGHIGGVPLPLYRRAKDGRGKERFLGHPLYRLIHDRPNPHMGSAVFRRTLQAHKMIWGNGFAEIERDGADRPVNLWPLLPYTVEPFYDGGQLFYRVHNPTQKPTIFKASDVLHIRGLGDDGICGYSVIQKARESIGLGIAAERFGGAFFGNGSTFGGVITYPPGIRMTPQSREENSKALEKGHRGVDNAHRFLSLYEGAKYERLGIPPNDAQFLETRQFQIEEICRWFNIPPHKLKHLERSTNNNIEHQGIEYVTDTLDPDWVVWEEELNGKLVSPLERGIQFFEHVREGLLRGDAAGRGEFYSKLFSIAAITPNEIRARENLNPIDGGDTVFVPLNTVPLDRLEDYVDAQIESKKTADPTAFERQIAELAGAVLDLEQERDLARRKAQEAEDTKDLANARLTEVQVALLQEQDAHASTSRSLCEAKGRSSHYAERAEQFELKFTHATLALETTEAERDDLARKLSDAETAAIQIGVERDEQIALRQADADRHATERAGLVVTLDARTAALEAVTVERDEALVQVAAEHGWRRSVEAERDAALARATELATALTEERATKESELDELRRHRDMAFDARDEANEREEATMARAEKAEVALTEARNDLVKLTADEQSALTERDMLNADVDTLQQHLQGAELALETERQREQARRAVIGGALSGLLVDTIERLVQRESDRARKAQATPEKLRTWVTNFYPLHAEVCRSAFRPFAVAWTALHGGQPLDLVDRLVREHVDTSETAIRMAADADDPDQMAAMLERTLRRWETERARAVSDGLLREGMALHG